MAKAKSGGLIHVVGARLRVTGSGNMRLSLFSLDDITSNVLDPIPMETTTNRLPTRLANFTDQRVQLEFKTTQYDERFVIGSIYLFSKPTAESYPQD